MNCMGKFIVFEGIDGSGKSTQIKMLAEKLEKMGIKCRRTLEPTFGLVGGVLHDILSGKIKADPKVTAALFVADRLDHILNEKDGLLKSLKQGETVICDRYYFSSYSYQSVEVPGDWVVDANRLCADTLKPDCTIFIDISPQTAMDRIVKNRDRIELYETEERLTQVRTAYFDAFRKMKDSECVKIIDGERTADEIAEDIQRYVFENIIKK